MQCYKNLDMEYENMIGIILAKTREVSFLSIQLFVMSMVCVRVMGKNS